MELTKDIINEFDSIANAQLLQLLTESIVFFNSDYNRIVAYYSGERSTIDRNIFNNLSSLRNQVDVVLAKFQQMNSYFSNLKWWVVLDTVEQIDSRLKTLDKINKWSRSSYKSVSYSSDQQIEYILPQSQTLERVANEVLGNDEWADIAISNDLIEEDYTPNGGNLLKLNIPNADNSLRLDSVVAVMVGKAIYGKDIDRFLYFDIIEEDIAVLDYDKTIRQSVDILSNLKRNSNPFSPNDGVQREVVVGGSRASLNFPIIQRQMAAAFATDDTLKNFTVLNLSVNQDQLFLEYQVQTRLNEIIESDVSLA
jgi:hypothetical protein